MCDTQHPSGESARSFFQPIKYPHGPLELVPIEFWNSTSSYFLNGNRYVSVMTNHFMRYVVTHAFPDKTASIIAKYFVEQFSFRIGTPQGSITNRGVYFNSELMASLVALSGTHHLKTAVYRPQANSVVERLNATFHPQRAKLYDAYINNWDENLFSVIHTYTTGQQYSTGYSPLQLMFGRKREICH